MTPVSANTCSDDLQRRPRRARPRPDNDHCVVAAHRGRRPHRREDQLAAPAAGAPLADQQLTSRAHPPAPTLNNVPPFAPVSEHARGRVANSKETPMITLATVNAYNLYATDADEPRYRQLEELIRDLAADIVVVQEIISDGTKTRQEADHKPAADTTERTAPLPRANLEQKRLGAEHGLRRLAAATDHEYEVNGEPALAVGGIIHHTGLLWRRGITPVPRSLHTLTREGAGMWHCAVSQIFDVGNGKRVRVGTAQLSCFDLTWATSDVSQLLRVFNAGDVPGLLGGDFNCLGSNPDYDEDPYPGVPWHPDHAYQLTDTGAVDRRPAHRLEAEHLGRMRDCARLLAAPWQQTTGHHPTDHNPGRRLDRWYTTHDLPAEAITGYTVIDADTVGDTTDHLPVVITLDESAL